MQFHAVFVVLFQKFQRFRAVPIPTVLSIQAVPAVPIHKSTAVLWGYDAVLVSVWNRKEPTIQFLWFHVVFVVPAVPMRVLTHAYVTLLRA